MDSKRIPINQKLEEILEKVVPLAMQIINTLPENRTEEDEVKLQYYIKKIRSILSFWNLEEIYPRQYISQIRSILAADVQKKPQATLSRFFKPATLATGAALGFGLYGSAGLAAGLVTVYAGQKLLEKCCKRKPA